MNKSNSNYNNNNNNNKRSLSTAWIDNCKAFDSVPHSWILKALDIYQVSPVIINFLKNSYEVMEY